VSDPAPTCRSFCTVGRCSACHPAATPGGNHSAFWARASSTARCALGTGSWRRNRSVFLVNRLLVYFWVPNYLFGIPKSICRVARMIMSSARIGRCRFPTSMDCGTARRLR
jgi:hypothetical protein